MVQDIQKIIKNMEDFNRSELNLTGLSPLQLQRDLESLLTMPFDLLFNLLKDEAVKKELEQFSLNITNILDSLSEYVIYDKDTHLLNKYIFEFELNRRIDEHLSNKETFGLVLLGFDIDKFKKVNDKYGHDIGDEVLYQTTQIISNTLKQYSDRDLVFRVGGEEFAAVVEEECESYNICEEIRKKIEKHNYLVRGGLAIKTTISVGLATLNDIIYFNQERGKNLLEEKDQVNTVRQTNVELKRCADALLYFSKKFGTVDRRGNRIRKRGRNSVNNFETAFKAIISPYNKKKEKMILELESKLPYRDITINDNLIDNYLTFLRKEYRASC